MDMSSSVATKVPNIIHEADAGKHGANVGVNKERITLRIQKTLYDRLEYLQGVTNASNVNEVVRNALLFYDALVKERLKGNDVYVISADGEKTKYPVFYS